MDNERKYEYKKVHREIRENLAIIGLSETEQDTLFALMEFQQPLPVSILALELEMPRQTANTILKNMSKRGIIIKSKKDGMAHFHANQDQISIYVDALCDKLKRAKIALTK